MRKIWLIYYLVICLIILVFGCSSYKVSPFPKHKQPESFPLIDWEKKDEAAVKIRIIEERIYVVAINFLQPGEELISAKWRFTTNDRKTDLSKSFAEPEIVIFKKKIIIATHQVSRIQSGAKYVDFEFRCIKKNGGAINEEYLCGRHYLISVIS